MKARGSIAPELNKPKHAVSHMKVAQILHDLDHRLRTNRMTAESSDQLPSRCIVWSAMAPGRGAISVRGYDIVHNAGFCQCGYQLQHLHGLHARVMAL